MATKKTSRRREGAAKKAKIQLIETDEAYPTIQLEAGMRFEVATVSLVDAELKKPKRFAARKCGGTSSCLAIIQL